MLNHKKSRVARGFICLLRRWLPHQPLQTPTPTWPRRRGQTEKAMNSSRVTAWILCKISVEVSSSACQGTKVILAIDDLSRRCSSVGPASATLSPRWNNAGTGICPGRGWGPGSDPWCMGAEGGEHRSLPPTTCPGPPLSRLPPPPPDPRVCQLGKLEVGCMGVCISGRAERNTTVCGLCVHRSPRSRSTGALFIWEIWYIVSLKYSIYGSTVL